MSKRLITQILEGTKPTIDQINFGEGFSIALKVETLVQPEGEVPAVDLTEVSGLVSLNELKDLVATMEIVQRELDGLN